MSAQIIFTSARNCIPSWPQDVSEQFQNHATFSFPDECLGMRLDAAMARCFPGKSRSQISQLLRDGEIFCAGKNLRPSQRVTAGLTVLIHWPTAVEQLPRPHAMDLAILYEDEHLLAIDKAPGIAVHAAPHVAKNLVEGVLAHVNGKLAPGKENFRPGVVHRLDKDTSGVIIFAKTTLARDSLIAQFSSRSAKKTYIAIASGVVRTLSGRICAPIGRDPKWRTRMAVLKTGGRDACTDWQATTDVEKNCSRFVLQPHSGRTHQIRVHLAHIGHPIFGDVLYGFCPQKYPTIPVQRVLLHASSLQIIHPKTGENLEIHAPLPADMSGIFHKNSACLLPP
ncbi:MAG: RluA family pseudouridine synthase [Puniceicoccales bacterium]|nr:RluA family pseudouridine synthase [Puniceicoccales bacterium]